MNSRRIALISLNAAGGLGLLFAFASNLSAVPDEKIRPFQLAAIPATIGAVAEQAHQQQAARILFEPVQQNAPKAAEATKPPFRLVGIVSQSNDSFAVVRIDERTSVELRLHEQIQGWRLEDLYRTSARFASKQKSVEMDLTSAD